MKKALFCLATFFVFSATFSGGIFAQAANQRDPSTRSVSQSNNPTSDEYVYTEGPTEFRSNVPLNEISIHAFRHFRKNYPSACSERWFKTDDLVTVDFCLDGNHSKSVYDKNGAFLYTLKYFQTSQIDQETSQRLRRYFPGFKLDIGIEVNDGSRRFEILTISNRDKIKTIQIVDDDIKIMSELVNAGA